MFNNALILIAEDEPIIALLLAMEIRNANGKVVGPASSVKAALQLIESQPIAGAILDVNLIDGDITPVAAALLNSGIPIILQSGIGLPSALVGRVPPVVFHSKPCAADELVKELASLVAQHNPIMSPRTAAEH